MFQCEECEFFNRGEEGEISLKCDPFKNVKGPECIARWQLIRTNHLIACYQATLNYYEKFAPMQEKMFQAMEKEIDSMNETESWRYSGEGYEGDDIEDDEDGLDDDWS